MSEDNVVNTIPTNEDKEITESSDPVVESNQSEENKDEVNKDEKPTEPQNVETKDSSSNNNTDNSEESNDQQKNSAVPAKDSNDETSQDKTPETQEKTPEFPSKEHVKTEPTQNENESKENNQTSQPNVNKTPETQENSPELPSKHVETEPTQNENDSKENNKTSQPSANETPVTQEKSPKLPSKHVETKPTQNEKAKPTVVITESNFWLDGNYRKVARRIEDGSKILDDLARMIHERAEIESLYANKLKAWQRKWIESCTKSFEYGTAQKAMSNALQEGVSIADLHLSVYGRLEELSKSIQQWRNDTYPKAMGMKIKESKRSEEAFIKAQKPWVAKYNEVNKCMKAYHSANHLFDLNKKQLLEAESSVATITNEQLTKLQTKGKKFEQDIVLMREKYEDALRDISNYNPKYQDDMKYEFEKCQKFECRRRDFMREKLKLFHSFINRNIFIENYKLIYAEMENLYNSINTTSDLEWYIDSYGPNHPFVTLSFVEYDEGIHGKQLNDGGASRPQDVNQSTKPKRSGVCTTL